MLNWIDRITLFTYCNEITYRVAEWDDLFKFDTLGFLSFYIVIVILFSFSLSAMGYASFGLI